MMSSVVRRKAATGASYALILGKSVHKIRLAVSTKVFSEEIMHCPTGSSHVTFSHLPSAGKLLAIFSKMSTRRSGAGDLVEAVIPHMDESITDCTLATFLRKPGDRVEVDEPIAQVETDKFIAKEGDIVAPGTKIAVISKSGEGVTHVAPSDEKPSEKADPSPLSPAEEEEKPKPKVETTPVVEKDRESSLPSKSSDTEPLLPPEERERRGLVVPVLRNAGSVNFAEVEKEINTLAKKAIYEMAGGTFTISNGGVYGSLLSTPIINPPQTSLQFWGCTQR